MKANESSNNNRGVKTIPNATTSVNVDVPIVFADNSHSRTRQSTRGVDKESAVSLVKKVLPDVLDATVKGNITKTQDGKPHFNVVDKQSCIVVGCTMEGTGTNDLKQFITIRTVFVRNQYHPLEKRVSIFYVNEDNPSEKWEEAEYYSNEYSNAYPNFRNYEKSFDSEHRGEFEKKKRTQMDKMWSDHKAIEPDRLGKDYTNAKRDAAANTYAERQKNGMAVPEYNLDVTNNAADNKILTKRGTNGMLRGMDRRKKQVREGIENQGEHSILLQALPDDIKQALVQNRTSLGNNPAIPDIYEIPYLMRAAGHEFEEAKDRLKNIGSIDDVNETEIGPALASLILECKKLETPYRSELEKICYNYVIDIFSVPEDSVDISLSLCDDVDTDKESIILDPIDGDEDLEFDDVSSAKAIRSEVFKRRTLDCICMGCAMILSENLPQEIKEEIDSIEPKLTDLYEKITALNRYALFEKEDIGMTDDNKMQMGTFELKLGADDEKCAIDAQGVILPFLLCETIRGFLELFISHGLPKDRNIAMSVLGKADFLKAEPWDMRLGPYMWKKVSSAFNDIDLTDLPYLFKRISILEVDKFNFLMKEVLAGTKKGRRIMSSICAKAKDDSEYDKFVDKMDKMKKDKGIITDDYIHPEEL